MANPEQSVPNSAEDDFKRLIHHVFLPRNLPGEESKTLVEDEANILGLLAETVVSSTYSDLIPSSTKNLFKTWRKIQADSVPNPENISDALRTLPKDGMFGFYVRAQNAAIMVYADSATEATLATFPASFKSDKIMSNSTGEVIAVYPEQTLRIPKSELLSSEALARQIVTLTNQNMLAAMTTTSPTAGSEESEVIEVHEVPKTLYISEWLTCLLSNATSTESTAFPKVCKKVRDSVIWNNSSLPFRRSGMWMTAKVILQLSLLRSSTDAQNAKFLYKMLMTEFMRQMCERAKARSIADIGMFMIKRLARRMTKLRGTQGQTSTTRIYMEKLFLETTKTCKEFKAKMIKAWKIDPVLLPNLQINKTDKFHTLPIIPKLDGLIALSSAANINPITFPRVDLSSSIFPNISSISREIFSRTDQAEGIGNLLYETESWIFKHLDTYVDSTSHIQIRALAEEYAQIAPKYYEKNPISSSRMVLVYLKIIHVLDQLVVKRYPMLKEHRIGIDSSIVHQLLLPLKSELEFAHAIELYCQDRDENAKYPALTEDSISTDSFSVRYAEQNEEMCKLREEILQVAEIKILGKLGQVKHAKKVCKELRESMQGMNCNCGYRKAEKECGYHAIEARVIAQRVKVYERPLRTEKTNQFAVVFELRIPAEIACLRDVVVLFLSRVCRATEIKESSDVGEKIWTNYKKLRNYKGTQHQNCFKLGSNSKLFIHSNYKELHPDNPPLSFIVNNGYNCTFSGNYHKNWKVKKWTTLKVEPNSIYSNLQWTLDTTNHFQNQVLAKQVDCPEELRLVEYKEFGSLRAGHRLQLRNILRSTIEKTLSLKQESVFALICQAIWEAGPAGQDWDRDSHSDLTSADFVQEWIEALATQLDEYEKNWTEAYTLLAIIVLTCRALEFGHDGGSAVKLLLRCREVAYAWICSIEDMIAKSYKSPVEHIQLLKLKLVNVSICICWTYGVSSRFIDLVLKSGEDAFLWTHALARIYNNIIQSKTTTLSELKTNLIHQIRNIALNIELKLVPFLSVGLTKFVQQNWNEGKSGTFQGWTQHPSPARNVYRCSFEGGQNQGNVDLQVDVIRGSFLVNGLPVGYLPEEITKHPTFSRVFSDIVFEVYPAFEEKTFVTTRRFNGADYRFTLLPDKRKTLIIRERSATDNQIEEFQLIPHELFKNLIPFLLQQNYSHWLNLKGNWIDFRPISFGKFGGEKLKYRLDLNTRELIEVNPRRTFFSVQSSTQLSTTRYLARLEDSKYVHTILDSDGNVKVELPRMRLRFQVDDSSSHLRNLEFGMNVCPNQSFGTFIGLSNGLLLENKPLGEAKLLMPHASARAINASDPKGHHQSKIDLESLRSPSIFTFDLDYLLKQLRAGKSTTAWLYLAYLHALTSSPLADPFTGLTGTEAAFQILQSGHCWSCQPHESLETLDILNKIKKLAPVRQYYPPHLKCMEMVTWPNGIPTSASQDGFRFLVDKLIDDSRRLETLFTKVNDECDEPVKDINNVLLSRRAYLRYESLCSEEGRIREDFLPITPTKSVGFDVRAWISPVEMTTNTRAIAELGQSWHSRQPYPSVHLTTFLCNATPLNGLGDPIVLTRMSIVELLELDFRNNWINLYELARLVTTKNLKSEWTIALSILAFGGRADLNHLHLLQSVAVQRIFFKYQDSPNLSHFVEPSNIYKESTVEDIFDKYSVKQSRVFASLVNVFWPRPAFNLADFCDIHCVHHEPNLPAALARLNHDLVHWNQNAELLAFVQKVESTIVVLPNSAVRQLSSISFNERPAEALIKLFETKHKFRLDFTALAKEVKVTSAFGDIFKEGFLTFSPKDGMESNAENGLDGFKSQKEFYQQWSATAVKIVEESVIHAETLGLFHSDLFRVAPTSLLKKLLNSQTNANLRNLIGIMGVLWTLEQRASRCIRYSLMGKAGIVPLIRELESEPHSNWSPADKPEWLLFEIESNLMIRPVQIDVAQQMISPPEGKHSVMQLNMGEGKTAVIVPILALALSEGTQVCRVTVLKSLFKTNFASLHYCLGGLLNRRLYAFPCQRDLDIDGTTANTMLKLYEECKTKRGFIVTLPEQRLSFQLKGYEKSRAGELDTAKKLRKLRDWISVNVRDILDESDEILHVKYQLIYTLGSQLPVDGGALRWSVAQSLIKLIPSRMQDLQVSDRPDIFHHTRLLKKECYQQLIEWLAEDVLDRKCPGIKVPELLPEKRKLMLELLTSTRISKDRHNEALGLLASVQKTSILILMGYLKYEILYLVLCKRWRVNYGVDAEGERKMAVPFRAKDVPSKRTEFGHPDVAIMLTQLSYYYSGLSNKELEECFARLNFVPNKEEVYASWIREVPAEHVDPSIKYLTGVNQADLKQKYDHLFPALRKNMIVIDFWLGQIVFPNESRVFEKKLVCTPWDLVSEDFQKPTTGFSGTNDSTILLPAPVSQQDLPLLQYTNDKMRAVILLPENNNVDILDHGISATEILRKLIDTEIPVLLDAGALMLELDNEGVARTWLELLKEVGRGHWEAAVYYDDDNELRVKHRDFLDSSDPLHSSSYIEQLDKCVIYLDDVHTRGTDLRIPPPSKACVTICAGITRDKMVQACMRMRLLGKGHTIHFFANDEAADGIKSFLLEADSTIGSSEVMQWVCKNSLEFEKDGLVYWATSGINYSHKRVVEKVIRKLSETKTSFIGLGQICCDLEFQSVEAMYGEHRHELLYLDVLRSQIERKRLQIAEDFFTFLKSRPAFEQFGENLIERCEIHINDKTVVSHLLDEEQEKEHEEEPEEEREIIRPPASVPAPHSLAKEVTHFIQTGDLNLGINANTIFWLHQGFQKTTMWSVLKDQKWCNEYVFITKDFANVIISSAVQDKVNEFLRTPNWIATYWNGRQVKPVILLLSPFEANLLIPTIRTSKTGASLRMFAPRLFPQQSTLIDREKLRLHCGQIEASIPKNLLAPLFVFSGTLYFANTEEQDAYCHFIGMVPSNNRTAAEEQAFVAGQIDRGFLLPDFRASVSTTIQNLCSFTKHPEPFIRQIMESLHGYFPQASHVSKLVLDGRKVDKFDN